MTKETESVFFEAEHSACGVGMIVNMASDSPGVESHDLVEEGLKILADFDYRSGYNLATEESDGSGIKFYGLSLDFFNQRIQDGSFLGDNLAHLVLKKGHFAIGHYFLPYNSEQSVEIKTLIERSAKEQGLKVVGWRDMGSSVNQAVLSEKARQKKPAIWQSIIIPEDSSEPIHEASVIKMGLSLSSEAREKNLNLNIISQSSESITYKGMLRATQMADFFLDLRDKSFTAHAVILHSRFATNTDPQWPNAQPCPNFWAHNGELNSAPANAIEMSYELKSSKFKGIYPNKRLSDSTQYDADLANQMMMKNIELDEAMMRLMSPSHSTQFSREVNAMLEYWSLERTPYDGPAFAVAGAGGYYMAKLDSMGLRPSRWARRIIDDKGNQRFYAASDDFLSADEYTIIQKGELEPGGMLMLTPEGSLLHTAEILEDIAARYHQDTTEYFQQQLQGSLFVLPEHESHNSLTASMSYSLTGSRLNRVLYEAGWDYESEDQGVRFMAEHGFERTGAMGDDTNVLYNTGLPPHIAYFFHQLFAQVSAPPLDSIKERDRFNLTTYLGSVHGKQIKLDSPILGVSALDFIEQHPEVNSQLIETNYVLQSQEALMGTEDDAYTLLTEAIQHLLQTVELAVSQSQASIIILSDRMSGAGRAVIPDLIAVAAVKKFLELKNLDGNVSIIADSYQINSPHQASTLLALGAKAVYPRGAYSKISELFPASDCVDVDEDAYQQSNEKRNKAFKNYSEALKKCLLKTMGKMGITRVNNYINSSLVAALGLDLSSNEQSLLESPTLAGIFSRIYSPLKGVTLGDIAQGILLRHQQAYDLNNEFVLLPRSGYFMPEKEGIIHGFGPEVVNSFTEWIKNEDLRAKLYQMHLILERKGYPNFIEDLSRYSTAGGFLDPRSKNKEGFYPPDYLEGFKPSFEFQKYSEQVNHYRHENPTSLHDYFSITSDRPVQADQTLQSQEEIRSLLFAGSMSQGALTVADPNSPHKLGAHEVLTRGVNAVGVNSASGEGGESTQDLMGLLTSTSGKQFASGRFGVCAEQILCAKEIEIKIAQGAKPGEGGELPGTKVSIRFAAQRGGLPHVSFISPPPHHDIYSIEDLEQLIRDIKSVNPQVNVAVKLVSSQGIGTIAVGVAKAGADIINIASNSGGTGAAQQSSIKHAGLPAELGLVDVDRALRKTKLRDLVKLRVSGGFKTAEDVLLAALLGADLFEFGTVSMLTLGCKMQRTCNLSCQPGVATDGHLFNGDQINTERYFVNLAASIQLHLKELGYNSLHELRGRTDLLTLIDPDALERYDFSPLLDRSNVPASLNQDELNVLHAKLAQKLARPKEDILIAEIYRTLTQNRTAVFNSEPIVLNTQDRSFGGRTVGVVAHYLQEHRDNKVILNTTGTAGQSYGFVNHSGMILKHTGTVQDGCGKSMTGGELILCTPKQDNYLPHQNTIAGNAMIYGASGGRIYVNGRAGHRFGILMKGAEAVVEGVGDFAFEYMTSGTGMILGSAGAGLATGASGGIIFAYDPDNSLRASNSVTVSPAGTPYSLAIQSMLKEHWSKTNSDIAQHILTQFQLAHFKILIPVEMDKINSLRELLDVIETFKLRKAPITRGMQVWLEQKIIKALLAATPDSEELNAFRQALGAEALALFSHSGKAAIRPLLKKRFRQEDFDIPLSSLRHEVNARSGTENNIIIWKPKVSRPVQERLATISGGLDHIFIDAIEHIQSYVTELSHNAEGCSGCRAQSCAGGSEKLDSGCPSGKGINTINALLKYIGSIDKNKGLSSTQWKYLRQAFEVQIQESPFIAYTGAACPAPCQDACTETIPGAGPANLKRGGKLTGEYVHIKDIEYYLYQVGRSLGWFDGKKHWTDQEIKTVFGSESSSYQFTKTAYDEVMSDFKPSFSVPEQLNTINKEVIIIGSGPAAMQIAYRALRDGIRVRMYERSNKPGGLLVDGIPAHKFDKIYLTEDFTRLQAMGLELYLNSDVYYDERTGEYRIHGDQHNTVVASRHNEDQYIALCIGTGIPKSLDPEIISDPNIDHKKIVQAVDFLKRANDIADELKKNSSMSAEEKEALIWQHLAHMDPRNKKIVVIGGGDTAQDVIRWTARYFNELLGELNILIRGGPVTKRAVLDAYPAPSRAPSYENELKKEEIEYIHGTELFLVEPKKIKADLLTGKLNLTIKESHFKYAEEIQQNPQLAKLFEELPRELKPLEKGKSRVISAVDLIISALGFQGNQEHSLVKYIQKQGLKNIYIAGDAAGTGIIVEAQNNANKIYGLIRKAMGIHDTKPYSTFSFFVKSKPSAQAEENESSLGLN